MSDEWNEEEFDRKYGEFLKKLREGIGISPEDFKNSSSFTELAGVDTVGMDLIRKTVKRCMDLLELAIKEDQPSAFMKAREGFLYLEGLLNRAANLWALYKAAKGTPDEYFKLGVTIGPVVIDLGQLIATGKPMFYYQHEFEESEGEVGTGFSDSNVEPHPLSELPPELRQEVERVIEQAMQALGGQLSDVELGFRQASSRHDQGLRFASECPECGAKRGVDPDTGEELRCDCPDSLPEPEPIPEPEDILGDIAKGLGKKLGKQPRRKE